MTSGRLAHSPFTSTWSGVELMLARERLSLNLISSCLRTASADVSVMLRR